MKAIKLEIELTYDDMLMHGDDEEGIDWFLNDLLMGLEGLELLSRDMDSYIGDVKVIRVIEGGKK
jgi:hypothetical protein